MRILVAVVHYWDPDGNGQHGSLRSNPGPRIEAFQQQLLALQRIGARQAELNIQTMSAVPANAQLQHTIDIKVITDGEHHVLDRLDQPYRGLFQMVVAEPQSPKHLGFEAQRFLASRLDQDYDLYAYFEDDLIVLDGFSQGRLVSSLPGMAVFSSPIALSWHLSPTTSTAFSSTDLCRRLTCERSCRSRSCYRAQWPGGSIYFESRNPHAGCFVLSRSQLHYWTSSPTGKTATARGCLHWKVLPPLESPKRSDCSSQ